ncbi:MAG: hypothetical protein ABI577_14190 [bacterium]
MSPTTEKPQQPHWREFLLALFGVLVFGLALTVATVGLSGGHARAAASDVTFSKSTGAIGSGDVAWTITVVNNSDTSQVVQVSDTYQPQGTGTTLKTDYQAGLGDSCVFQTDQAACALNVPAHSTAILTLHSTVPAPQCGTTTASNNAFATVLGLEVNGSPDNNNLVTFLGSPGLCENGNVFQLCKQWEAEGVLNTPRSFTFNVSDSSQTQDVTLLGVQEGGSPVCADVEASGLITVTETVPGGFLSPAFDLTSNDSTDLVIAPNAVQFLLLSNECFVATGVQVRANEANLVPAPSVACTLTVTNRQVPTPPSPSPPPTSPPGSCTTCVEPTSTPTSKPVPPTPTAAPSNTPAPPPPTATATATPISNSGVTDPNAVDAAKTAAAAITPLPPRTGETRPAANGASSFNVGVVFAGLVALAGGMAVLGSRRRRRS